MHGLGELTRHHQLFTLEPQSPIIFLSIAKDLSISCYHLIKHFPLKQNVLIEFIIAKECTYIKQTFLVIMSSSALRTERWSLTPLTTVVLVDFHNLPCCPWHHSAVTCRQVILYKHIQDLYLAYWLKAERRAELHKRQECKYKEPKEYQNKLQKP